MLIGIGDNVLVKYTSSAAYVEKSALTAAYVHIALEVNGEEILNLCRTDNVIFNTARKISHQSHVLSQQFSQKISPMTLYITSPS